jgi:glycosyltransferase involved in cell wall biosynthesis
VTTPFLSIIIPVVNEEKRLPPALEEIDAFLRTLGFTAEVLVVENGSADRTYEVAQEAAARLPYMRVLREKARGKGLAVRRGMLEAQGEYRIFCDVDFSMPVKEISRFIPPELPEMDVAIASREKKGAVRYGEPAYRHFIGRGFNALVRWLALPGLQDTQCGFKCFRKEVAERIFPLQTIDGWTFDVEVLFIARRMGYRIVEVPIPWYYNADSKVRVFKDSYHMFTDLVAIRLKAWRGVYGGSPLQSR